MFKTRVLISANVIEIDGIRYRHHENGGGLVAETADVADSAFVNVRAMVAGRARVLDSARILDTAGVTGQAVISGNAVVGGSALVAGSAQVSESAQVWGDAEIEGRARISGSAQIGGSARIGGYLRLTAVIANAMKTRYGHGAQDVVKQLVDAGFVRTLAMRAATIAEAKGRFSIWSVVDALTQVNREQAFAGNRSEADEKAARLLTLAAN